MASWQNMFRASQPHSNTTFFFYHCDFNRAQRRKADPRRRRWQQKQLQSKKLERFNLWINCFEFVGKSISGKYVNFELNIVNLVITICGVIEVKKCRGCATYCPENDFKAGKDGRRSKYPAYKSFGKWIKTLRWFIRFYTGPGGEFKNKARCAKSERQSLSS